MIYKNNNFIKYQEKQRWDEVDNSNRSYKRKLEKRLENFYFKNLQNHIDKIWWDNLETSDKINIEDHFYYLTNKKYNSITSFGYKNFNSLIEWFDYIKKEYKPNKINMRKDKFKKLGI